MRMVEGKGRSQDRARAGRWLLVAAAQTCGVCATGAWTLSVSRRALPRVLDGRRQQ